jgi:phosphohistidine phosphatase SixA
MPAASRSGAGGRRAVAAPCRRRHRLAPAPRASAEAPPPPPRRLILLRHAASEEAGRSRNDHDRPVSARGREEARAVAARLAALGWRPDLIVGSNSRRTVQTLDAMAQAQAEAFGSADAHLLGALYTVAATDGQTRQKLSEVIAQVAGEGAGGLGAEGAEEEEEAASSAAAPAGGRGRARRVTTVMAVGHNRGWEEAASSFARASVRLQTATAALLEHVGGGGGGGSGGGEGAAAAAAATTSWAEALAGEWRLVRVVSPSSSP